MLDHGDMFLRCDLLPDRSEVTSFEDFYTNWISYYDALCYIFVNWGSNIASKHIRANLHALQLQLYPIPVDVTWSLGANERSHKFLHKAIDRLSVQLDYNKGHPTLHFAH